MKKQIQNSILVGSLNKQTSILQLLILAHKEQSRGVLRVKQIERAGAIWFIHGNIVHAIYQVGESKKTGYGALAEFAKWNEGNYFFEKNDLPPDRSIRDDFETVIVKLSQRKKNTTVEHSNESKITDILSDLKKDMPDLESISLLKGKDILNTTLTNPDEITQLELSVETYYDKQNSGLKKLFLQQEQSSMIFSKNGMYAAIVAAKNTAAPEMLFKAAEEVQKKLITNFNK